MIYEINHIWTAEMKREWRNDRSSESNLCNCVKKPENKKFRTSTGFEPVTFRLPVRCSTNWAKSAEKWSSQWTQFVQFVKKPEKKFGTSSPDFFFLHSHFISAVHIWFISYIINTQFFHGNISNHNWSWPAPNVRDFIAQLVEHRTKNREVTGSSPV